MKRAIAAVTGVLALSVCGGSGAIQLPDSESQPEFSEWSEPVNLGEVINSSLRDVGAALSRDGLSLYFASARSGVSGTDLYVSRRRGVSHPWETPEPLVMLNTPVGEGSPSLSHDDRYLFFNSGRPGGSGATDFYVSERRFTQDDFGWDVPVRLPSPPNSPGQEVEPTYIENPDGRPQLYFGSGLTTPALDIYVAELGDDGTWTMPEPVAVLNSATDEGGLAVRFDGLEGILGSRRGGPDLDLYVTRRKHRWDPWSAPENLGLVVNSTASDFAPSLSRDGRTLFFASARPGGLGNFDLYASTRRRIR